MRATQSQSGLGHCGVCQAGDLRFHRARDPTRREARRGPKRPEARGPRPRRERPVTAQGLCHTRSVQTNTTQARYIYRHPVIMISLYHDIFYCDLLNVILLCAEFRLNQILVSRNSAHRGCEFFTSQFYVTAYSVYCKRYDCSGLACRKAAVVCVRSRGA